MTTGDRVESAVSEMPAALVGVPITAPNAEILVQVEHALATVPAAEDWDPGDIAAQIRHIINFIKCPFLNISTI